MLLVGTVLGGGFVSGKELVKFYGGSGKAFLLCSILTGIGYALIVLLVMKCSKRENRYELSFLSKTAFSKCYRLFDVFLLICYFIIMSAIQTIVGNRVSNMLSVAASIADMMMK